MSEFSPRSMLIRALKNYDASRPRSQQEEVGPSAIYGCERQVYHQLKGTKKTNPNTEHLPAILGTFIHAGVEKALESEDPFGDNFLREFEVEYDGLKGHIDLYIKSEGLVCDLKTTSQKNLKNFPSAQNIYQIQIYAYLLKMMGYSVKKVSLVVIPRDGKSSDIVEYVADYDEDVALKGIKWLDDLKELVASEGKPPRPERNAKSFCQHYCQFYDPTFKVGCGGK